MTFVYHNFYLFFTVNPISLCEDNQDGPLNLLVRQYKDGSLNLLEGETIKAPESLGKERQELALESLGTEWESGHENILVRRDVMGP